MNTQVDPFHNIDALDIVTVEFHFSNGARSAADAKLKGYRHLGNILEATPKVDTKKTDHWGSYRGRRIKDKSIVNEIGLDYSVKCDELTFENLLLTFSGTETTAWIQNAMTLTAADTFLFTALVPTVPSVWYDLTIADSEVRHLTAVALAKNPQVAVTATFGTGVISDTTVGRVNGDAIVFTGGVMPTGLTAGQIYYLINVVASTSYKLALTVGGSAVTFSDNGSGLFVNSSLVEGTDFEVDLDQGRIRLITTQTTTLYPYVTGPAVVAGGDNYMRRMIPLDNPTRSGMGKLLVFDQDDRNKLVWAHTGFSCEVMIDSLSALDGQKFVEQVFAVSTTGKKGFIGLRQANLAYA